MEFEYVSPKALQARDQSKHPQKHPCGLPGFLDSHPRTAPLQRHDSSGWGWCGDKATEQTNLPYLGIWHHDSAVSHRIRDSKKNGVLGKNVSSPQSEVYAVISMGNTSPCHGERAGQTNLIADGQVASAEVPVPTSALLLPRLTRVTESMPALVCKAQKVGPNLLSVLSPINGDSNFRLDPLLIRSKACACLRHELWL